MIIKGLKVAAAKKRIPALVDCRKPDYCGFPITTVGLVVDAKNKAALKVLRQLQDQLEISDANFKIVFCGERSEATDVSAGIIYSLKDFDLKAGIRNEELRQFASQGVDLLITFAQENNTVAHLLTAYTSAGLKVGRYPRNKALYDLILQCGNEPEIFREQLLNYLKKIKKPVYE